MALPFSLSEDHLRESAQLIAEADVERARTRAGIAFEKKHENEEVRVEFKDVHIPEQEYSTAAKATANGILFDLFGRTDVDSIVNTVSEINPRNAMVAYIDNAVLHLEIQCDQLINKHVLKAWTDDKDMPYERMHRRMDTVDLLNKLRLRLHRLKTKDSSSADDSPSSVYANVNE